jgi:hypothetical protein
MPRGCVLGASVIKPWHEYCSGSFSLLLVQSFIFCFTNF